MLKTICTPFLFSALKASELNFWYVNQCTSIKNCNPQEREALNIRHKLCRDKGRRTFWKHQALWHDQLQFVLVKLSGKKSVGYSLPLNATELTTPGALLTTPEECSFQGLLNCKGKHVLIKYSLRDNAVDCHSRSYISNITYFPLGSQ